ncbi:MAG: alpha/beta hydrolase [Woeseiaceae bacterium]|nr:alpha/beta hydrolase [Woeseiaceae bacterium]
MRIEAKSLRRFGLLVALTLTAACEAGTDRNTGSEPRSGSVISTGGVQIHYDDHGSGPTTLVLVHGWSCDRSYWSEQVEPLSRHYRVVTLDLGGHGQSGLGRPEWTIASFGQDVAAVIDALQLDSVVLVGHSMGGDVIFQAARLRPEKVRALIMLDTYKQLGDGSSDAEIDAIVEQISADFSAVTENFVRGMFPQDADPDLVDRVAADMAAAPPEVAISAIRSSYLHAREIPDLIASLGKPVVAINPDDAPTHRESMSRYGVDVVIMRDVGHFLMMEDPARFNELLLDTLDELL